MPRFAASARGAPWRIAWPTTYRTAGPGTSDRAVSVTKKASQVCVIITIPFGACTSVVVRRFAVRADVESLALVLFVDAQAHQPIGGLVGDERDRAAPEQRDRDRLRLREQLH